LAVLQRDLEHTWQSRDESNTVNVIACLVVQLNTSASELENIQLPSDDERKKAFELSRQLPVSTDDKKWRLGEHDFEMLMKQLDNVVSSCAEWT
jgi:hypothetical protein